MAIAALNRMACLVAVSHLSVEFDNGLGLPFRIPEVEDECVPVHFGFAEPGNAMNRVSVVLDPVFRPGQNNSHVLGIDDISYVLLPEPHVGTVELLARAGLMVVGRRLCSSANLNRG